MPKRIDSGVRDLFDSEEVREVLERSFYKPDAPVKRRRSSKPTTTAKPDHYEIICISLYKEDLQQLDKKVETLKSQGHRKMSRSALIRYALDTVDMSKLPRSY